MKCLAILWIFIFFTACLFAQDGLEESKKDSIEVISNKSNKSVLTIFKGKPGRAALYSLILPGAGQFYNRQYWKLPFVYAAEGTAIYFVYTLTSTHRRLANCYESIVLHEQTLLPIVHPISEQDCPLRLRSIGDAFDTRNRAKTFREYSWLALIGVHLFQSLEAYINRHLIDFDVDEDLTFSEPIFQSLAPQVKLGSLRFNLNKKYYKEKRIKELSAVNP